MPRFRQRTMPPIKEIRRLRLNPDDKLVIALAHEPTSEEIEQLRKGLKAHFPHHEVLVHGPGTELRVIEASRRPITTSVHIDNKPIAEATTAMNGGSDDYAGSA